METSGKWTGPTLKKEPLKEPLTLEDEASFWPSAVGEIKLKIGVFAARASW